MQDIIMKPIGCVKNCIENKKDVSWGVDVSTVVLNVRFVFSTAL